MCESDDELSVTFLNNPVIRAWVVISGESLRQAEVSAFRDYHITPGFFHVVISLIWNIGVLHMEAITLRSAFPWGEMGVRGCPCIMPRGLFFPEALCPLGGQDSRMSYRAEDCECWHAKSYVFSNLKRKCHFVLWIIHETKQSCKFSFIVTSTHSRMKSSVFSLTLWITTFHPYLDFTLQLISSFVIMEHQSSLFSQLRTICVLLCLRSSAQLCPAAGISGPDSVGL